MTRFEWLLCWIVFRIVLAIPITWRVNQYLLPCAGVYAFTDGGFAEYRADRTGFCSMRSVAALEDFELGI